jgi:hypothetical protein
MIAHKLTGTRCRCTSCGELFNSTSIFSRHRVGSWKHGSVKRRCLRVYEMIARGWVHNVRGFWIERARIDVTRGAGESATPATLHRRAA